MPSPFPFPLLFLIKYTKNAIHFHAPTKLKSMNSNHFTTKVGIILCLFASSLHSQAEPNEAPQIVPTPKSIKVSGGSMPLTAKSKIIATEKSLEPLAKILADELSTLTGMPLASGSGSASPGDIVLKINVKLRAGTEILAVGKTDGKPALGLTRDFSHTIVIGENAVVEGWDYRAVCEGTSTLLQALSGKSGSFTFPRMTIQDWPQADYTGTMIDLARQRIPIDTLKAVIEACRLWKVRYCQLHLSDNESFTFPSTAFPKLGSKNLAMHEGLVPQVYALQDLKDLVAFADARGVTLVPELATPNHSEAMCRALPEIFAGPRILNLINDKMYESLETLVGEICEVFKSSPYFHIGGEEPYFFELQELPATKTYLESKGMKAFPELIVQHQERMISMLQKRGKMTLAWEGATVIDPKQKDQMVIMSWIPYPVVEDSRKKGFAIITVPWERGAALQKWNMNDCNGVKLTSADRVLGSSVTMWQMSASAVVSDFLGGKYNGSSGEGYIRALGDQAEGAWAPLSKAEGGDDPKKLLAPRAILESLLFPVRIAAAPIAYRAWPVLGFQCFSGSTEVKLSLADGVAAGEIHYTIDATEPTSQSPVYATPLAVTKSATIYAALFRGGKQVGAISRAAYHRLDDGKPSKAKTKSE